jgi:hypothetical protein
MRPLIHGSVEKLRLCADREIAPNTSRGKSNFHLTPSVAALKSHGFDFEQVESLKWRNRLAKSFPGRACARWPVAITRTGINCWVDIIENNLVQ